ncbi:VOC family protein [Niveispirillum fermenti]|uniref:VOC family protein n=1 Tax=Niveispirillum fermenti TaxID=1233113 RepID=UPI003A86292D
MTRRTLMGASMAALGLSAMPLAGAGAATERPIRIRHYVLATHDMEFVCDQIYEVLGLPPMPRKEGPGVTEQYGFYSTMLKVGTTMIEVVQPIKPDHLLNRWFDERGGDGGFMVVMQTFDPDALKARAAAEGLALTRDMMFKGQHMLQFDYKHFGTHFELYKYTPEEDWWGDPRNRPYPDARVASDVVGGEIAVEDPEAIAAQTARLFLARQEGTRVHFEDRTLNFVEAKGQWRGLVALDLKAREKVRVGDWARIGGVKLRFV